MGSEIYQLIQERRAERMRLGQAVMIPCELVSDPEIRIALVPLTDAELQNSLMLAAAGQVTDTPSTHEVFYRDRVQKCGILMSACRRIDNLQEHVFNKIEEVLEMDSRDVNHLFDAYQEMMEFSSPSLENITDEEMDEIKKVLSEVDWNALSGRQWYAAKRFLIAIQGTPLQVNSLGSSQTNSSITTNGEPEFTNDV